MNPNAAPPRVIIRHCDGYDAERIRAIVRDGLRELDLVPHGRTLVKPNLVAAELRSGSCLEATPGRAVVEAWGAH
jgi:hypothetical protein